MDDPSKGGGVCGSTVDFLDSLLQYEEEYGALYEFADV